MCPRKSYKKITQHLEKIESVLEGLERALEILGPHWGAIEARFQKENKRFESLMCKDHDALGRLLKSHLILEHYLDRFLCNKYPQANIEEAELTFYQKAKMLPDAGVAASLVKPGILKLNNIRNTLGHDLTASLDLCELGPIDEVLKVARRDVVFSSVVERLESFTTIACTFLIVSPPELEKVLCDAFSYVRWKKRSKH